MGYQVKGLVNLNEKTKTVWTDYYKFVNYAKEDIEKTIVKEPMKWLHNNLSSAHDITINGLDYKKVTFTITPIHFKVK